MNCVHNFIYTCMLFDKKINLCIVTRMVMVCLFKGKKMCSDRKYPLKYSCCLCAGVKDRCN